MVGCGTLYGIGVGPGDPGLIPVKSVEILERVDIIFSASSTRNNHSLALDIAAKYIPEGKPCVLLPFPMIMDKKRARDFWEKHALKIIGELKKGKDAAFLTLGDPLTYSTFGYLLRSIEELAPYIRIEVVPGITSYQAAAATTKTVLVEGEESLLILSGAKGGDNLRRLSQLSENIVFLKAYKYLEDILQALKETRREGSSVAVTRCGFEDEKIIYNLEELLDNSPLYWTLIISKRSRGPIEDNK